MWSPTCQWDLIPLVSQAVIPLESLGFRLLFYEDTNFGIISPHYVFRGNVAGIPRNDNAIT